MSHSRVSRNKIRFDYIRQACLQIAVHVGPDYYFNFKYFTIAPHFPLSRITYDVLDRYWLKLTEQYIWVFRYQMLR